MTGSPGSPLPPLRCVGLDAFREHWERTFASFTGPVGYEIHELDLVVRDDLAVTHSLNRRSGAVRGDVEEREQWLRWTACWRKRDGCRVDRPHPVARRAGRAYSQPLRRSARYTAPARTTMTVVLVTKPQPWLKPGYGTFCP